MAKTYFDCGQLASFGVSSFVNLSIGPISDDFDEIEDAGWILESSKIDVIQGATSGHHAPVTGHDDRVSSLFDQIKSFRICPSSDLFKVVFTALILEERERVDVHSDH